MSECSYSRVRVCKIDLFPVDSSGVIPTNTHAQQSCTPSTILYYQVVRRMRLLLNLLAFENSGGHLRFQELARSVGWSQRCYRWLFGTLRFGCGRNSGSTCTDNDRWFELFLLVTITNQPATSLFRLVSFLPLAYPPTSLLGLCLLPNLFSFKTTTLVCNHFRYEL